MLVVQRSLTDRLYSVWAEKSRLAAKSAVIEQWSRGQKILFGKFKHIGAVGDHPIRDGSGREVRRLLNLDKEWSFRLTDVDVTSLKTLADSLNFQGVIFLF